MHPYNMPRIFVYGSLKKGFGNHAFLNRHADTQFCGSTQTDHCYKMAGYKNGSFPYVLPASVSLDLPEIRINGEIYEVSEACLESLDRLEGHPHYYTRCQIYIDRIPVYIYLIIDESSIEMVRLQLRKGELIAIPSGIWNPENTD